MKEDEPQNEKEELIHARRYNEIGLTHLHAKNTFKNDVSGAAAPETSFLRAESPPAGGDSALKNH